MTNKPSALDTVHQVAKQREEEKAKELQLAQDEELKHKKYLTDLESYRHSYSDLANHKGAAGISSSMFRHYQGFLNSIDQGITQQKSAIANMQHDLAKKRDHWQNAHQYSEAVQELLTKKQAEKDVIESKREQVLADEFNLRQFQAQASQE